MKTIKVAILGAGYAGVHAAKALHKKFKKDTSVEITVYDKNPFHTLMTELHEVAGGRCEPESVRISLEKIFGGKRVNVVVDKIADIDFAAKRLKSDFATYDYDYLILGPGAEPEFFGIPGVADNAFTLWSYDDAVKLREHIVACFLQAKRQPDPVKRKALLTFAVAGAGFTGIEMFGELLEWKKALCREYHIDPDEVTILNVEAMTDILPTLGKDLRAKALKFIAKKGGKVLLNTPITVVKKDGFTVKSGEFIPTETLIWTCGVKGCAFAGNLNFSGGKTNSQPPADEADGNLRFNIKKKSRLASNEFMQSVDYDNVYITGDVLWFHEKNRTLPQMVETALQTGECAAHNIIADIENKPKKAFRSNFHGMLVSIGSKFAVADVMGIKLSGWLAMAMKHLVNVHYLWEVAGANTVWGYIQHHFLGMRNDRSLIGNHGSQKSPTYWTVPLRMFLGGWWILEGVNKILDGWLKLDANKVGWMFSNSGVAKVAADATAAATATAEGGDYAAAGDYGLEATSTAVTQVTNAIGPLDVHATILDKPFWVFQWFLDTFGSWVPPWIIQYGMTFAEIGLGLLLLGGLFTMLAADATYILGIVFLLGGMLRWDQTWLLIAAIAVKGGAGKSLGLDYWVMPWLQNWWNGTKLAKKTYLYWDEPVTRKPKKKA